VEAIRQRILSSEVFWTGIGLALMLGAGAVIAGGLLTMSTPIVVAGTFAALGCGIILVHPYLGVLLFLALLYGRPEQFVPQVAALRLPFLLALFTMFAWLVQVLIKRETFRWRTELGWMIALGLAMAISAYRAPDPNVLIVGLMDALRLAFLFVLLQQLLNTERRARLAIQVLLALTVLLALYAIRGWITGTSVLVEHGRLRAIVAVGDFDDPNDLSAALVIAVPVALLLLLRAKSFWARSWGGISLAILLGAIYLCNSRGGMLALGVAMGIFLVYQLGWTRGCLLGAAALALMVAFGPDRFDTSSLAGDDSALGRIQAWEAGLRMFTHNPLFGVGYEQFEERHPIPAHNSFVHGLGEGGLVTALAWVGLNYWAVLQLVRLRRQRNDEGGSNGSRAYAAALQAGLLASLAAGMFLSHTYRPIPMIPVALASALGAVGAAQAGELRKDWPHYLAVLAITLAGVAVTWLVVRGLL
jgi:O-antigen ligase